VDLSIEERDLACIVGPNAGGKTTLLRLILGLIRPTRGEVRVLNGDPVRTRRRIGYMPQYAQVDPLFPVTVMDVVLMGRIDRRIGGPYSSADKVAAKAALADVGMLPTADRPFSSLSGGQRQRVLIARAIATEPDILILDEPTANVDVVIEARFYDILRELNRRMTILVATHDLGFVSGAVRKVICVNREVYVHPTGELDSDIIQEMYGGDLQVVRHDHRIEGEEHTHE
jgi:zinc transport system ATP-binding protein